MNPSADWQTSARRYARVKRRLLLTETVLTAGFLLVVLVSGFHRELRELISQKFPLGWPAQAAAYAAILSALFLLLHFPLDLARSFVVEHRFHLSTQRFGGWLWEYLKGLAVSGILGLLLLEILMILIHLTPANWWLWATALWILWSIFLTWVAPTLLIPIFYRQRPLEDPSLGARLESLLARCRTRVEGIFEINLSKTTRKANACLCGWGSTRRVLLSDTLLASHPPQELEAVLAHEIGHHRLRHLPALIASSAAAGGIGFFAVHRGVELLGPRWGVGGIQDLAALPLAALIFFGIGWLLMPITHGISRRLERAADRFSLEATRNPEAFAAAMERLGRQNLAELEPPRWVEFLLYTHPSIARRIAMARRWKTSQTSV